MAARATTLSLGPAAPRPLEDFLTASCSLPLTYTDFSCSVVPRLSLTSSTPEHSSIFQRITHPYNSDAFESLLLKHGLLSDYPLLPSNLRHGFPLGHMPALTEAVILPNNPFTHPYIHDIHDYLQKELQAGRMSGPFSREHTELILRGPFQSSPLIVDVQPQQRGTPDKIRICRHLSKSSKLHPSVNSHIRKEDFPTRFDLASKVAEIVSFLFSIPFPFIFSTSCYTSLCVSCVGCFLLCCYLQLEIFACLMRYLTLVSMILLRNLRAEHTPRVSHVFLAHLARGAHVLCFQHLMMFISTLDTLSMLEYLMVLASLVHL